MTFESYVDLARTALPERVDGGLPRIRLADHCTAAFAQAEIARVEAEDAPWKAKDAGDKAVERERRREERERQRERDRARELYTKGTNDKKVKTEPIEGLRLPEALELDKVPPVVSERWALLKVDFTLSAPWYSRDDYPFHVLDNPVRKDRVFGVPFMAAASWKGLLRWACRMEAGLLEHLNERGGHLDGWNDPEWIVHLFGNEREDGEEFSRGSLQFFPTWFHRIGFEVINPHNRETRAGRQPIVYEVVPAETTGRLAMLYAPAPGREPPSETMANLVRAVEVLLTVYGFSAKRTAGWGLAEIRYWLVNGDRKNDIQAWAEEWARDCAGRGGK
jgi:CRISPR-associated protein Cmr2